jgi:hypothetical protein
MMDNDDKYDNADDGADDDIGLCAVDQTVDAALVHLGHLGDLTSRVNVPYS